MSSPNPKISANFKFGSNWAAGQPHLARHTEQQVHREQRHISVSWQSKSSQTFVSVAGVYSTRGSFSSKRLFNPFLMQSFPRMTLLMVASGALRPKSETILDNYLRQLVLTTNLRQLSGLINLKSHHYSFVISISIS